MQALLRVAPTEPRGPLGRPPTRSLFGRAFPTAPSRSGRARSFLS